MSKVRLYAAMSLDGCIADSSGAIDWLGAFDPRSYGFEAFLTGVGSVVMGRRTFEQIATFGDEWPYGARPTFVLTSRRLTGLPESGKSVRDGIGPAVSAAREASQGDVWIVGGAVTMRSALEAGLVDQIDVFVVPVLLGAGIPLLGEGRERRWLTFETVEIFKDGVVHLAYATAAPKRP